NVDEPLIAAANLVHGRLTSNFLVAPSHQWVPESRAAHRKADESGNRRGGSQPLTHPPVVLATAQHDAADFVTAATARGAYHLFTVFPAIDTLDLPDVGFHARVL